MSSHDHDWACASCGHTQPADREDDAGTYDLSPLSFAWDGDCGLVCYACQLRLGIGFRGPGNAGRSAA